MDITEAHYKKFIGLLDHGLVKGLGIQKPGKMCVEAAWCAALGLPHGDNPGCVGVAVRSLKIRLNDSRWSSNKARAAGLLRLGIAQIGSDTLDQKEFTQRIAEQTIRQIVPIAMRAAAKRVPAYAVALEAAAVMCEKDGTEAAARTAQKSAAAAYAAAAAAAAAADAAAAAADDAAYAAAYAADAADAPSYQELLLQFFKEFTKVK